MVRNGHTGGTTGFAKAGSAFRQKSQAQIWPLIANLMVVLKVQPPFFSKYKRRKCGHEKYQQFGSVP